MSFVDIKAMAPKAEEKAAEGGKGNGKGKEKKEKVPAKLWSKEYALKQISSLDAENDDHRESVSKIISWILRKGHAANIGIVMVEKTGDALGFAKVADLASNFLFEDFMKDDRSEAALLKIIESSNEDKKRYETKDIDGSKYVQAVKRTDRKLAEKSKGGTAATGSSPLKVAQNTALRAEAPEFNPGDSSKAYSAGYSQFPGWGSYPGYGYNQYAYAQMWAATAAAAAQAAQSPGEKRYTGRIKSYNAEKGFGFIQSDEAYQSYKRDVFLHKAHLGSFAVNSTVSFKVEVNKEGMPQARDLVASEGEKGGKGKGKGKGKKGEGKGKGKGKGKKEGGDGEADKEEEKPAEEEKKDDAKAEEKPAEEKKD